MARFTNRSLEVLNRIYRFVGTHGLDRMNLEGDIQPVHDMSRESELGARDLFNAGVGGGYIATSAQNSNTGAETTFSSQNLYEAFDAASTGILDFDSTPPLNHRLWLIATWGTTSTGGGFTTFDLGLRWDGTRDLGLWRGEGLFGPIVSGGDMIIEQQAAAQGVGYGSGAMGPLFLPLGTLLRSRYVSSATSIAQGHVLLWAGVLGAPPPGLR